MSLTQTNFSSFDIKERFLVEFAYATQKRQPTIAAIVYQHYRTLPDINTLARQALSQLLLETEAISFWEDICKARMSLAPYSIKSEEIFSIFYKATCPTPPQKAVILSQLLSETNPKKLFQTLETVSSKVGQWLREEDGLITAKKMLKICSCNETNPQDNPPEAAYISFLLFEFFREDSKKFELFSPENYGKTLLKFAIHHERLDCVELLFDWVGKNIETVIELLKKDFSGNSSLHYAAKINSYALLFLLEILKDCKQKDKLVLKHVYVLCQADEFGNNLIDYLLRYENSALAIFLSFFQSSDEYEMQLLIECCSYNNKKGSVLMTAAKYGNHNGARLILEKFNTFKVHQKKLLECDHQENSILHYAAQYRQITFFYLSVIISNINLYYLNLFFEKITIILAL